MTELKPCPFCGGEAQVFHFSSAIRDEVWRAVCDNPFCVQGPDGYTEAEAIAAWNSRAEQGGCRMKVYIVETYDQLLDGPYVEPTCYANREDAIRRVESQTYTDPDGINHWATWRELKVVSE